MQWNEIFKVLEEKKNYSSKLVFKNEGEINIFPDSKNWENVLLAELPDKKNTKDVLQAENKWCWMKNSVTHRNKSKDNYAIIKTV